jgi:hypothetical protein
MTLGCLNFIVLMRQFYRANYLKHEGLRREGEGRKKKTFLELY